MDMWQSDDLHMRQAHSDLLMRHTCPNLLMLPQSRAGLGLSAGLELSEDKDEDEHRSNEAGTK
jgi:hypothetical protein